MEKTEAVAAADLPGIVDPKNWTPITFICARSYYEPADVIKGDTDHYCGSRMLAGTILVLGGVGTSPGLGMRRGTLVLASRPSHIAATFNSCGILKVEFLRLLFKQLSSMHNRLKFLKDFGPEAERFVGDMALGGKGELVVLTLT
jgi:formylmethanofuran dehydrogenase subunit C